MLSIGQFRYVTGVGVPLVLMLIGVLGKKLSRRSRGWIRNDFYLGGELTLAAISSALLNIFDLLKPGQTTMPNSIALLSNFLIAFVGFGLFLFVLSMHQDYESNEVGGANPSRRKQLFVLAGVCNVIGFGLLLAGIILIPRS